MCGCVVCVDVLCGCVDVLCGGVDINIKIGCCVVVVVVL